MTIRQPDPRTIPTGHLTLTPDQLHLPPAALLERVVHLDGVYLQTLVVSIGPDNQIKVEGWSESSNVVPLPAHPKRTDPSFLGTAFIHCQSRHTPTLAFIRQLPGLPAPVFQINAEPPFLLLREADPQDSHYNPRPLHGLRHSAKDYGIDRLPSHDDAMRMLFYRRQTRARGSFTSSTERADFQTMFTLV